MSNKLPEPSKLQYEFIEASSTPAIYHAVCLGAEILRERLDAMAFAMVSEDTQDLYDAGMIARAALDLKTVVKSLEAAEELFDRVSSSR